MSLFYLGRPANCPDAIVRRVEGGRKKWQKIAYFSRFSDYLAYFAIQYWLEILNEGRREQYTAYWRVLENLVWTKFVNYTKKCWNSREKWPFLTADIWRRPRDTTNLIRYLKRSSLPLSEWGILIFLYLHSFTPKNGVKVGRYYKNGYF